MRDAHRMKEKLEVSLDNRQIFFLFFGSAVVACLVFVVGVMVGKKLEARKAKRKRPAADELALIDEDTKNAAKRLSFHRELIKPDEIASRHVPQEVFDWRDMGQGAQRAPVPPMSPTHPSSKGSQATRPGPAGHKPVPSRSRRAAERTQASKYTLQVSAFQRRSEADQMLQRLQAQGYRPYVVASNIPNRGVWYRVRLGEFRSWKQAIDAKKKFEEKINMTAYVSRR